MSPAHTPAAEGKLCQVPMQWFEEDVIPLSLLSLLVPPSSKSPVSLRAPFSSWAPPLFTPLCCADLLVSSSAFENGSPGSASGRRARHSTSANRPVDYTRDRRPC